MQRDYQELLEEIKEITTVDGFVASCLEIKESMYFYERDLMLAAYTASLELLAAAALLNAVLKGKRELIKAEGEVERCVEGLLTELERFQFPLDIQYVVDRFLQGAARHILWRLPVYFQMMRTYASTVEELPDDLDLLLRRAHRLLHSGGQEVENQVVEVLGQVGAKMLRGARLRPIWVKVSHPRLQVVLMGLQTLMNNLRVTPYFNYPLEELAVERQKRSKVKGNVVADLGVFRNFRQGGSGFTELNVALHRDEYDEFLESFFSSFQYLEVEPDQKVAELITAILEARLVHGEMDERFLTRLIVYASRWQISATAQAALELLEELDLDNPFFYELWSLLNALGTKAFPAIRRFVRTKRDSALLPYLALFLSQGPPSKRRWSLLKEIFENYPQENEEKAQLALSIGRYGGEEAVAILEQALAAPNGLSRRYRQSLERALALAKQAQD